MNIRVFFRDEEQTVSLPLEYYLKMVVPAEMPAEWHVEALKAMSVAARSYSFYAIHHPRHKYEGEGHVCDSTHCHVYNPKRQHPRSDQAVEDTRGMIMIDWRGQPVNAVYHANCGGATLGNEIVWKGKPVAYLRGVDCPVRGEVSGHRVGLCQHGARALATDGFSWIEILQHYYTGIRISEIPRR